MAIDLSGAERKAFFAARDRIRKMHGFKRENACLDVLCIWSRDMLGTLKIVSSLDEGRKPKAFWPHHDQRGFIEAMLAEACQTLAAAEGGSDVPIGAALGAICAAYVEWEDTQPSVG